MFKQRSEIENYHLRYVDHTFKTKCRVFYFIFLRKKCRVLFTKPVCFDRITQCLKLQAINISGDE